MIDALWLLVLGVVEGWALWAGQGLLTLAASLGLLVSLSLVLSRRFALSGVRCRQLIGTDRANFGDVIDVAIELVNLKPLPLTWLRVQTRVPRDLGIEGGRTQTDASRIFRDLVMVLALLPYERVIRRLRVHCDRRGEHQFGPTRLESGDYLGVLLAYGSGPRHDMVLVFPKVLPLEMGRVASDQLLGRDAVRRPFLPDPMRVIGARRYQSGDPYRMVDWRATARAATLMTRILEPSSTPVLDIVLDFTGPAKPEKDYAPDELEFAICVVASLAAFAAPRRLSVGVRGNGYSAGALLDVPPSAREGQLRLIMEALARSSTLPSVTLGKLLAEPTPWIPHGATTVVVSAALRDEAVSAAVDLRRRGRSLQVIYVADDEHPIPADGLPIVKVTYDPDWPHRETLVLVA